MSAELKASRKGHKSVLTREVNSTKRLMAEDNATEVQNKLKTLKEKFLAFEESHDAYHNVVEDETEKDASEEYFNTAEQVYIDAVMLINEWLKAKDKEIKEEAAAQKAQVKEDRDAVSRAELLSFMNLPKLELETFSGDPLHYHNFMAVFEEHVDRVTADPKMKLSRLLQSTSGVAKDAIRSCSLMGGEKGYTEAREILRRRFGDEHLICDKIVKNVKLGKAVKSSQELRELADELVSACATLESMKKLCEVDTQSTIVEVLGRLQPYLQNRWKRRALEYKREKKFYPNFRKFVEFIVQEAEEATDPVYGSVGRKSSDNRKSPSDRNSMHDVKVMTSSFTSNVNLPRSYPPCVICGMEHRLFSCDRFRSMKPLDRLSLVKQHRLCENCLLGNHVTKDCRKPSVCSVPNCGKRHTKFIHVDQTSSTGESGSELYAKAKVNLTDVESSLCSNSAVFVPTVKVLVNDSIYTSALLDTGSTNSFCTKRLVNMLGVTGQDVNFSLSTLGLVNQQRQTKMVNLKLKSNDGTSEIHLSNVCVVDNIPVNVPCATLHNFVHLHDLPVHDFSSQVDVLIGQDNPEALIPLQTRCGKKGEPFAVKTSLGWSVNGPVTMASAVSKNVVSHFINMSTFDDHIKQLWEIESDTDLSNDLTWSHEDKQVIKLWDASVQRTDGHYELPIPWKANVTLPNNYSPAMFRLKSTLKSLAKKGLVERYDDEMQKLLDKGYAEVVPFDEVRSSSKNVWYLPHHAVINPKKPDKVRIVFDCAAQCNGKSLNNQCYQGPDLNNRLVDVLLRFRQHQVAIMGDIESMYHQVKIPHSDRDALRFMWYNQGGDVCHYRMTSHLFGGVWCAASATYALRRVLHDFPDVDNEVAAVIRHAFYVDDCLLSVPNKENAVRVVSGVRDLLAKGGFNLTKFVSNDAVVLSSIPEEDRAKEVKDISQSAQSRVLGVKWNISSDLFYFDVVVDACDKVTKRSMLSVVSSIFDPLGFVNPVVIAGRLLFQEAVRLKLSWDEPVPSCLLEKWSSWLENLQFLNAFQVTRCFKPSKFDDAAIQLHHFSDASLQSYGFCTYVRSVNKSGEVLVELLLSKCRVVPLKAVSVPRLELQAALLAARADKMIRNVLNVSVCESFFWTDSSVVLSYIQNDSLRFHVFVGNRVSEIRQSSVPSQWNFIAGADNPADLVTRGENPRAMDMEKWLHGPRFLHSYMSEWQIVSPSIEICVDDPEVKQGNKSQDIKSFVSAVSEHPIDKLIAYYSSWYKLKRAVAWFLRLQSMLKPGSDVSVGAALSVDEIAQAEVVIVKHVQSMFYANELSLLSAGKPCKSSKLRNLSPVLDANGVICVGGRLSHAGVSLRRMHPFIVPHGHAIADMIAGEYHSSAHVGTEWTLALLRDKFWVTKARSVINRVRRKCVTCKKLFAKPVVQYMADLPPERLEVGKPLFSHVGVDCFGNFFVKQGRSNVKRYGCVFTCLNVRAVHIEVLHSMDADSFINAFRRFVARRGLPLKVWSDNGTNFVGAHTELSRALKAVDKDKIASFAVRHEVQWVFNPPGASHMGGIWERVIRTIKRVLSAILVNVRMSDEMLSTLFCEVENIVNSRPITKLANDAFDGVALTPNHLLLLTYGVSPPPGLFHENDKYTRRWRHVQHLVNQFWHRWVKEYLPQLQTRGKWHDVNPNVKVDDVVLIVDEHTPRGLWPLGRVIATKESRDGLVRTVHIKTKSTVLTRPITKIVSLEVS